MIPGAKPRAILTMLGLHGGSVVSADALVALLWGDDPPRTAGKALQTHISALRRALGDGFVLTQGSGWSANATEIDASRYKVAAKMGRDAAAAGDTSQALAHFEEALKLWRGVPELPDTQRGASEKTRWIEGHAALVEDRADALLATGRAAEIIGELEAAVAEAPLRERRWGQLMLALYRAGRQGEALGTYQRARSMLANELGVDPGPNLRRLEAAIVAQDAALEGSVAQQLSSVTRAVTFLLTDIEGSTAAWEADADTMASALARHDELVEQVVTSRGGRLIKTRGEGDATFSVFDRPSAAAAAAIELQDAISHEPWALQEPMRIRVALHTGEVELRDGDYFGRAVNRAARLRSLATGGQILCSGATAELVIDSLSDDVVLADLGMRQLRNLPRPEHVFELRLESVDDGPRPQTSDAPMERPAFPAVLTGPGPFVGRGPELERLLSAWQTAVAEGVRTVLIAGEPGVGKTRLAGEWSGQAYEQGAVVLYGRCDEDLGAPYQPFAEALRALVPCLGASRLRGMRGVEALLALVPGLTDVLPDVAAPTRADPDTERYALFDAVVAVLEVASTSAPVVLILDDLHWAAKPTLLLLRHLLRFGEHARVQVVGTYRSTDLDRSHPLAAMLADLHRDGTANRLQLSGLDEDDVTAYVAEAGYDDEELARALASVTGGNPFFLIEALRHVDESGGVWDPTTLPQGVRETVSRRLSRLPEETNKALAAAAVVGSRFALDLVEQVVDEDLVDAFDEACKAGIIIEEPGGRYRFNHAIVRQSLLAELASVRRMRLHQRIATTLENQPGADDELLAELAYHYFECAWAGNAAKAVDYCRRAADQAMARLAYEGAADLYDRALHALEEIDDELPDREDQAVELLVARCEALLAAGDVASAAGAVSQLQEATHDSARLAAWATCFDGQLSMLTHPERLDDVEAALGAAADKLAELDDAAGEAKAHTVRAGCLARLGRIGDCETALDDALTAARRSREHRRVNQVLAGAPLAALWGPNPVPRAGGRCLDVVRLLRITTDSPAVEATSTRCQAVLEAFRGRAEAARRMIDSARRMVTELGLRHALLEVEQFAGIVELVVDDPGAAEPHLRKAYNGFRRMGLDADTAETAALLGRACLALDLDAEADELCSESERLAGHVLKASIAWRTLRAQLRSRRNDHEEARRVAEAAVTMAERTDALVDHGDACLALAAVLAAAADTAGARAAAERAVGLYEQKGAAALADKARSLLGKRDVPTASAPTEPPIAEPDTACVRVGKRALDAIAREAWDEYEQLFAPEVFVESRRKIVGFTQIDVQSGEWPREARRNAEMGGMRPSQVVIAVRGERLALARLELGTADESPGAPQYELLHLYGIDEEGRIALQLFFDIEDIDAAIAELDALHARFEEQHPPTRRVRNAASRIFERLQACFTSRDWDTIAELLADDIVSEDRRRVVNIGFRQGRDAAIADMRVNVDLGVTDLTAAVLATRGGRLALMRTRASGHTRRPEAFHADVLNIIEIDAEDRITAGMTFDLDAADAAFEALDARYVAGEAAPYSRTWSVIARTPAAINRHELPTTTTPDWVNIDHRRGAAFAPGEIIEYVRAAWELEPDITTYIETVHRLSDLGAVVTHVANGTSQEGFAAEWRLVGIFTVDGDRINRCEIFDETDIDAAIARFEQLSRPTPRLENAASQVVERFMGHFATYDWNALADTLADDFSSDDRRRMVGAGVRYGRDAEIAIMRATADLVARNVAWSVIAARGERLVLMRVLYSGLDQRPEAFHTEVLCLVEINADERIAGRVWFDANDIDAAYEELDTRYPAGEAAAYAHTWSVIAGGYDAFNRGAFPATTPDWANIDHRRARAFAPGELATYMHATWDLAPDVRVYVEAVHRLNTLGAVVTQVGRGTSQEGFDAEWREIVFVMVESDLINRIEIFDEVDIDAAIAKFEQLTGPAPRLENAASRLAERFWSRYEARDWDALRETLADDVAINDCRPLVNFGLRQGPDSVIEIMRAAPDMGVPHMTQTVIATRGERLVLIHTRFSARDQQSEALYTELLSIVEIDADERIAAGVVFDLDDIDAAFEELDGRYLGGEAAAHAHTWSLIVGAHAAFNRRELPAVAPDLLDHRPLVTVEAGDPTATIHSMWDFTPDLRIYIEAVHRLSDLGAVFTQASHGTSQAGFHAEWRIVELVTIDGDLVNRGELFEEGDIDAALARFEELHPRAPRLENAASQVVERFLKKFAASDWDAMAEILAADYSSDDRRRVVNAGLRHGRDGEIENYRAAADLGITHVTSAVIATRGERLVLSRVHGSQRDQRPETFGMEVLGVTEINADERIVAVVVFDLDDIDAAFDELDARYLAGEAAAHAHTWSVIARGLAAINRRELPELTPDWVNIDHRRAIAFAPGEMTAYIHATLDDTPEFSMHIEAVHGLSDIGVVITLVSHGTSQHGFDAEWRMIQLLTVEGDLSNRCEIFDEADIDAAIARFEELHPQAARLENAASRVDERFQACFAARDWAAMGEILADDISADDRRRVVNAGIRHGRDAKIADMRATADLGTKNGTSTVIAIRGQRLALVRIRLSGRDQRPDAFHTEMLGITEINADNRMAARVLFDPDDIDAAFDELDARYLAGEAAAHSHTWSLIARVFAAINRRELPELTPDWVNIDHRRGIAFAPGDMTRYIRAIWDDTPDVSVYIEAVHGLSDLGAVVTQAATGTSQQGFAAEWRAINISTVDGDLINHCELFDEADIDAALARFEELHSQTRPLENAASQASERFRACFAARDWDAMAEKLAADYYQHDRRPVVGGEIRRGRDAEIVNMRTIADLGFTYTTSAVIATRGDRLALTRTCTSGRDQAAEAFHAETLCIIETDADERITATVIFELDDIDAAFQELESRYLAGEAADYSQTWSLIADTSTAFNRREMFPTTPDWVNIDHRRAAAFAPGEMSAYTHAIWDDAPDSRVYIEAVHRLNSLGAVVTEAACGTSQQGFEAEWRLIGLSTVDRDLINRCEMFDEADLDAALARFEELQPSARRLENAASQVNDRFDACFAAHDWDAMAQLLTDNTSTDDRRRVVNAGIRQGRDVEIASMRSVADIGVTNATSVVIAVRGRHLALSRTRFSGRDQGPEAFLAEMIDIVEIDADERIVARVAFDVDDIEAAFEELEARYLAGEAAACSHTWSVITGAYASLIRHELPPTTPDWVNLDHRRGIAFAPGDMTAYIRAKWDHEQDGSTYIETVLRLNNLGAVFIQVLKGTSQAGFDAEWRIVELMTVEGGLINRAEVFDEADVDPALARFDELSRPAHVLENAASQVSDRYLAHAVARDWDAITEILADDYYTDDRRHVVGGGIHGRDVEIENLRAGVDLGVTHATPTVIATRGDRLALSRIRYSGRDQGLEAFLIEILVVVEINADDRTAAAVVFDVDDIDPAFKELDGRYLAGEAAAHSHTWSVIARTYAAFNRHELPAADWVNIDHRRGTPFASSEMTANLHAFWDLTPDFSIFIEAVHRLNSFGAVVTHTSYGTSQEGFDAEWRMIALLTVDGDRINRCELFDEADLDTALARFEELHSQVRPLENAASQAYERCNAYFAVRDWSAMAETFADDMSTDDRRRVVGAGIRHGRDALVEITRAIVDLGMNSMTSTVIAIRGARLVLTRARYSSPDRGSGAFVTDILGVVEIDADNQISAHVVFDPDDLDAAFEELDARYLAGEAADHSQVWSVIAQGYAALNSKELPSTTSDWVTVDHRVRETFEAGDLSAYIRSGWDIAPNVKMYIEAVHRLSNLGAVVTHAAYGTSPEGFDAEWRMVGLLVFGGDDMNRCELFEEADLDAALAGFEELNRPAPRLRT
jgi:class 3 adenylate cyclase